MQPFQIYELLKIGNYANFNAENKKMNNKNLSILTEGYQIT